MWEERAAMAPSVRSLVYHVVWSTLALEFVVVLGHLAAGMLFAVDDFWGVGLSLASFSLLVWAGASLVLLPVFLSGVLRWLVERTRPSPAEANSGSLHDAWLDDRLEPWT